MANKKQIYFLLMVAFGLSTHTKNIALVYQFTPGYNRLKELQIGLTLIEKQLPQNKTLKKINKNNLQFLCLKRAKTN